ncbi:phytanoyl-CoA dioxygenase family protein [Pedobacter gandavensis]|uniref:phytanoyl-CoA dioxygenase family protein n=1 Tax=Pedobacter gandavensis TaxID=2679963 RepID=UPI00292FCA36|nr:phytanoyl-CoA dioxygenase family protein [Pedobacter gandavensis]
MQDLSEFHHQLTDTFKKPASKVQWEEYRLTDEQVQFFNEHGYLSNIKLLEEEQVEVLKRDLQEITNANHPGNHLFHEFHSNESSNPETVLFHALGAWRITKGFHDTLWNPAFLMAASQLLGNKGVRFWHDQLFCKPAKHGGVVAWHQDYSYWTRTVPMQHLTCWIGLDDSTTENGCLLYVPKSHKWGLLEKPELAGDMNGIADHLTEKQKEEFVPVSIEMKKGYGTFHHPLLLHGSNENKSNHSRGAFVLNVFADGTQSASNKVLLNGVPAVPEGDQMEGQFFPLLFDPAVQSS